MPSYSTQEIRLFCVYRQYDVAKFCSLLDKYEARLVSVTQFNKGMLNNNFLIAYCHPTEIIMEVLT